VVEGWYGQPYPRPLERTREYVTIVRDIVRRDGPVEFHGKQYDLPYTADDGMGIGKALKSTVHPIRTEIPIYLGAEGPKNVSLAGEIADGWLPLFFSPKEDAWYRERLQVGFDASGDPGKADRFEVASLLTVIPGDDVEEGADLVRPFVALYAGGMGAKGANFHFDVFDRMGWGGVATKIQELYLEGKKQEAAALIPLEMVEDVALVGPPDKIRDEMAKWKDTCLTTVLLTGQANQLERLADLVNG
jgi:F420-dependent oxidoreductase-like protein